MQRDFTRAVISKPSVTRPSNADSVISLVQYSSLLGRLNYHVVLFSTTMGWWLAGQVLMSLLLLLPPFLLLDVFRHDGIKFKPAGEKTTAEIARAAPITFWRIRP